MKVTMSSPLQAIQLGQARGVNQAMSTYRNSLQGQPMIYGGGSSGVNLGGGQAETIQRTAPASVVQNPGRLNNQSGKAAPRKVPARRMQMLTMPFLPMRAYAQPMTQDNVVTNDMVRRDQLPLYQREIY